MKKKLFSDHFPDVLPDAFGSSVRCSEDSKMNGSFVFGRAFSNDQER